MASRSSGNSSPGKAESASDSGGGFIETVRTVSYAVVFALVVRTFLFEPFNIPSGSMVPTLLVGDYLFVSKYTYGYSKHSFPFSPSLFSGRIFQSEPERGDVAVFKLPTDNKTDYIKRIVGLPGDRIQMISGILHVNGTPVIRRRIADFEVGSPGRRGAKAVQYREVLPGGVTHPIIEMERDSGYLDNTAVYAVPKGHYFMMGDNRDNSQDSRVLDKVGFVPAENLVGKAQFLFFSTNGTARLWEVWKWPFTIRYGRLFNTIN
jgi:signal peptidase I